MLESIVSFFTRMLQSVRRGIRLAVDAVLAPFRWAGGWFARRGGIVKAVLGLALLLIVFLYGWLFLLDHAALDEFQSQLRTGLRE